jgi:hypothetical protein
MFTISIIYKNQTECKEGKKERKKEKRVAKQKKRIGLGRVRSC